MMITFCYNSIYCVIAFIISHRCCHHSSAFHQRHTTISQVRIFIQPTVNVWTRHKRRTRIITPVGVFAFNRMLMLCVCVVSGTRKKTENKINIIKQSDELQLCATVTTKSSIKCIIMRIKRNSHDTELWIETDWSGSAFVIFWTDF